jgi:autotransporter-associated beta strand protein
MNTQTLKIAFTCLAVLVSAPLMRAGTIVKTNNTDNLNLTTSWVGSVVPGPLDVARWDSTVTGANPVALGADTSWGGILIANPGGAVTIGAGNTLTVGTNGINMSGATQNLTISSGLTLGGGLQTWNVTNATTLTASGTFTRPVGSVLAVGSTSVATAGQGTVAVSPTLENGVLPWATAQSSGTAANASAAGNTFATVSGGNIVAYTSATAETTAGTGVSFGGIPTGDNSTLNYDLAVNSTGAVMSADTYVNTLRNVGGAYLQPGTANFRANAMMNAGTGLLTLTTPVQQSDTNLNELVLATWTAGIMFSNVISDNINPLHITTSGGSSNIFAGQNTYSGGITINSGRVGIRTNSVPATGTVTSGPLGTGTITMNGGILFSSVGNYALGNPIVIGPGGGQFQFANAQPDLILNGNITGSGPVIMNGVFNVNGLFFNGDDSAYNGTVTVAGSNNRLGNTNSGSVYAKWVINGGLAAQLIGGGTYEMGDLSGSTGGCLCGHAVNTTPSFQEFVVGFLNTSTIYLGIFADNAGSSACGNSDGAANNLVALTKVGSGTLILGGNSTASGPVHINGGTLQLGTNGANGKLGVSATVVDNANLTIYRNNAVAQGTDFSGAPISGSGTLTQAGAGTTTLNAANTYTGGTIVSGGALFVNAPLLGTATVMSGATLGGAGAIAGVVTVQSGGQLAAGPTGASIGTLTLSNTPVLGGSVFVKINAATAQSDRFVVTGGNPINYGGTLVVSNIDGPLLAGDSFTIVTAGSHNGSFGSIVGNPGAGLAYSFANGVLSVVSTGAAYATNSTPATLAAALSGGGGQTLSVSWPADHLGWVLQSQTNDVDGGISTNPAAWIDMPATATVNLMNVTNPSDLAVYYRMRLVPPPTPSGAPTGLTAKPTNTAVILSWTAPASYARSYNIKNSTVSGGPYTTVGNTIATTYTNAGLINGTTYYFVVSALNYYGESANSAEVSATPLAIPPAAPTGLTAQSTHSLVQLNWTAPISATSYNIKRGTTPGGPYSTIATVSSTTFNDTTVTDGTTYYYVVSGINNDGEGPNSSEVSATPAATPPVAPATLTATAQYLQVRLNWTGSFGATSYNVKYATVSGGPYTTSSTVTGTSAYVTGLTAGTPYYFVVSAVNGIGEGANSSEATATPTATLPLYFDFENTSTNYSVTLPSLPTPGTFTYIYPLPDPFYYVSDPLNIGGSGSTNFSDWEHHRAEFLAEIQAYEIGTKPVVDPSMISVSVISNNLTTRRLVVWVTNIVSGTPRVLMLSNTITLPASVTNTFTFPVCIGMNGPNGSVNASLLTAVAKISYTINQVTTYGGKANTDPFYVLYAAPYSPAIDTVYTGQYAAWAWGCSRIIDGLYKVNGNVGGGVQLDLTHMMVTGCSYAGKMALFCGATDERVALTIAQESGGGGANSWRFNEFAQTPGTVEDIDNTDYGWFAYQMHNFGGTNVAYMPDDHHLLDALVAPRALFCSGNPDYVWLGNPSCYVCSKAVEQIYGNFGLSDRFGYNIIGGHAHCSTTANIDSEMGAFINKFLLQSNSVNTLIRDVDGTSTNGVNAGQWTAWWGTTNPILGP